ncbi:hypothetical protein Tco_0682951 [Tanacetum coccineum]|uniref:FRIGIDA-like protein n=1 Tax=Tanacetum coccineum TaxID=301880 RepID=A0ABQ4XU88_9ASTR
MILAILYKEVLHFVEEQTSPFYKKMRYVCDQIDVLKRDASFNESEINALKIKIERLKKEKKSNQIKIDNFENASKSLDKLIGSQISDNNRKGVGPKFEGYGVKAKKNVSENSSNEIKKTSVPISTARQSSSRTAATVSTARPIKTAAPKPFVNVAKTRPNAFQKSHSPSRRPFYQQTALKNRNLNNKVNTVKVNSVNTAKEKRVTSAIGELAESSSSNGLGFRLEVDLINKGFADLMKNTRVEGRILMIA